VKLYEYIYQSSDYSVHAIDPKLSDRALEAVLVSALQERAGCLWHGAEIDLMFFKPPIAHILHFRICHKAVPFLDVFIVQRGTVAQTLRVTLPKIVGGLGIRGPFAKCHLPRWLRAPCAVSVLWPAIMTIDPDNVGRAEHLSRQVGKLWLAMGLEL